MADRSLLTGAAWTLAIAVAAYLLVDCGPAPAPQSETSPVPTTLAPERPPEPPVASAPTLGGAPTSGFPPATDVLPAASAEPQVTAPASGAPSPVPTQGLSADQEQRIRSELAAAKTKAESLSAASNTECPDLKPGEMRHPGAVGRCARLRSEAASAVSQYEALKKQAQAAGITVQ